MANMLLDGHRPRFLEGTGRLKCRFRSLPLLPQSYSIVMAIRDSNGKDPIIAPQDVGSFNVVGNLEDFGFRGERLHAIVSKSCPVVIPYEWCLPDGSTFRVALRDQGVLPDLESDENQSQDNRTVHA